MFGNDRLAPVALIFLCLKYEMGALKLVKFHFP